MSRRLAAWLAVLCIAVGSAFAQAKPVARRPVAIVDLTLGTDPRAKALSRELFGVLSQHAELEPLEAISVNYANALLGVPIDDDQQHIASARLALQTAEEQL